LAEYLLDQRPPLEAQLIDLTDEIAYNTADLDDGYESDILSVMQIRDNVPAFNEAYERAEKTYPLAMEKLKFNEALKIFFHMLVTALIENTRSRLLAAGITSLHDVRHHPERLAAFSAEADRKRREAKEFLYANLYYSPDLKSDKYRAAEIVSALFEFWMNHPEELPKSYREQAGDEPLPRIICDYIAGMTDNFISAQYELRTRA
jgi:dGTPase